MMNLPRSNRLATTAPHHGELRAEEASGLTVPPLLRKTMNSMEHVVCVHSRGDSSFRITHANLQPNVDDPAEFSFLFNSGIRSAHIVLGIRDPFRIFSRAFRISRSIASA